MSALTPTQDELLVESGMILEANRTLFHPLGYDLVIDASGAASLQKHVGTPGVRYSEPKEEDKSILKDAIVAFESFKQRKHDERKSVYGFAIQPSLAQDCVVADVDKQEQPTPS